MRRFGSIFPNTKGYTLDQTILIVAIIAILVTLVILTVAWTVFNKAGGTKLAAQLKQIEDANTQFYNEQHLWPDTAMTTGSSKDNNVVILTGVTPAGATLASVISLTRNYLSGFKSSTTQVNHNFSSTGLVEQLGSVVNPGGLVGKFLMVQFTNVPFVQVQQAEWAVDGQVNEDYTKGRLTAYKDTTGDCLVATLAAANAATATTTGYVNVCYVANDTQ